MAKKAGKSRVPPLRVPLTPAQKAALASHKGPSKASLREMPEVDFTTGFVRRGPEGLREVLAHARAKRGRPKKGETAYVKWNDIKNGKLSPEQIAESDRKVARTVALKPFYYAVTVQWSDEDAVYVARVPVLPGCAAHGDSLEDAVREVRVAAEGILESMAEHGDELPDPWA
jgi:predicted RNase H-like HicB family nuclease